MLLNKIENRKASASVGTNRAQFLIDGNSNNRVHYGTFYCNLNNTVTNANWNYDVAQSYPLFGSDNLMPYFFLSTC